MANSKDPDKMPHNVEFHQGLHCVLRQNRSSENEYEIFILEIISCRTMKTNHHIFALFLQTVYAIENLLAGFNVQPRIGMKQSLI